MSRIFSAIVACLLPIILTACAPASTPAPISPTTNTPLPTATATVTPEPTITFTPEPTATPVTFIEGLDNVPEPDDDFINQVVSENYLRVMGLSREQVDLVYVEHTGIDGEAFFVMLDETTGVPLAVYTNEWEKSTLKFFGRQVGIVMGTDTAENLNLQEKELYALYDSGIVVVGMEWWRVEPEQGKIDPYELSKANKVIDELQAAGVANINIPILSPLWPDWLTSGKFTQDELREIMKSRIQYVIENTPEADSYVVINEPYLDCDCPRELDPFYKSWGNSYDYIIEAYEMARAINPNATLIYNDSANEGIGGPHTRMTRMIAGMLHERGLVDYVGMQMHLNQWSGAIDQNGKFNRDAFLKEVKFYEEMGIPVLITEMTYEPTFAFEEKMSPEQFNDHLSDIFGSAVSAAIESGNVYGITFWGLTDKWLLDVNWYMIFDENAQPKQSYYIVLRTLYEGMK